MIYVQFNINKLIMLLMVVKIDNVFKCNVRKQLVCNALLIQHNVFHVINILNING